MEKRVTASLQSTPFLGAASAPYCASPHCSPPLSGNEAFGEMQNQQLYPNHAVHTGMASRSLCDPSSLWSQQYPAVRHCVKKDLLWVTPCLLLPITLVLVGIEEFLISIQSILHLPLCPTQCPKTSGPFPPSHLHLILPNPPEHLAPSRFSLPCL